MAWLAPVAPDIVWFRGDDAVRFLNDLLSQEIADMGPGEVRRSMLLKPDGKVQHLLWVLMEPDGVGLITEPGRGEAVASDLARYRIRVDVTIELESEPRWLVMGEWDGIDVSWSTSPRFVVRGERPDLPDGSAEEYERLRVEAGEPVHGIDVSEESIPQETGLVDVAVHFEKGCFVGQELVGRIDARGGNVPRPLRLVEIHGSAEVGDEITHDGKGVGRLTSAAGDLGLAAVMRKVEPGQQVTVGAAAGVVRELPSQRQNT